MKLLPFEPVKAAALAALPRVLDWAGVHWKQVHHEIQMINPTRSNDDGYGSFSINAHSGVWADFASGDKGGDVIALVAYLKSYGQGEACKDLARLLGIVNGEASAAVVPAPLPATSPTAEAVLPIPAALMGKMPRSKPHHPGKPVQFWRYNDAAGHPLVFVVRLEPGQNGRSKDYFPLSVWRDADSGKTAWRWKNLNAPRPLYGLDRLAARPDAPVVICEGEKAADAAAQLLPDHVAMCWMNGAEAVNKADFRPLAGRHCLIWRDYDAPGWEAATAVAAQLATVGAAAVSHVPVERFETCRPSDTSQTPALLDGGQWDSGDDAADALARGWTAAHLRLLLGTEPEAETVATSTSPASEAAAAPAASAPRPAPSALGNPFKLSERGVYFQTEDMDTPLWICSKLEILARTRDKNAGSWGLLVCFTDPDGNIKEWNIPSEQLASSEGAEVIKGLLSRGLLLGAGPKARQRLLEYLARYDGNERATIVPRLGWHDSSFLLPDIQLGQNDERLIFEAAQKQREAMQCVGSLEGWQSQVACYCIGNSRLAFSVASAFAGPLLGVLGSESGGFHFYGDSSQGKTTLLQAAASVFGEPGYLQTWRATDNALEAIAAAYSDCLLTLDEIHQCDSRIIGEAVYMLGNGRGKSRANDKGGSRGAVAEWRVLFLSSGEKTLAAHMAEAKQQMKAGMEIRMLAIQAYAGQGFGLFDTLHDKDSGQALSDHIKASVIQQHGSAARAYLERLVQEKDGLAGLIRQQLARFDSEVLPGEAHGQAHRAAARFALVGIAGELASAWGVTGWPKGTAWQAAKTCFADWLKMRGTSGNREDEDILAKVRLFFEQHGEARFTRLSNESILHEQDGHAPDPDDHAPKTISRCGYRLKDKLSGLIKYYVLPESFRSEVCAGMDVNRACKLLTARGALETTKGAGNMLQVRTTPEAKYSKSGRAKVYCVTSALFADHAQEFDDAA
ncbi:DUF927 domain-containing protein [Chromobacterium vaccinii]|uniref:DUF927 domain-containing protein n=1 Tax=Chromobacterium vaccinii TaxID=1108595 RepID=UPI000E1ACA0C|nr:DUF927 domain-containing protein [Chromobacterium vaccinii]SUX28449.1 Superfamily II helicase and inactivated derivatives [Chromobacterium vaccinii]